MPLNFKKVTTEDAIRKIEDEIAYYKKQVAFTRSLSKSGNKKELLEWLHEASRILQTAANNYMGNPNTSKILRATSLIGELRGIRKVIDLFENVDTLCFSDQQQIELRLAQLKIMRELPKRADD